MSATTIPAPRARLAEQARPEPAPPQARLYVAGAALTIVGALLLAFVLDVLVVGHVRHARDQQTAFADLRGQLANGTAVVNQSDDNGRLWPLGTPLGVLDIPQLGLREVFFEGTTSGVLESGPGHERDTPLPGQAGWSVLMGRHSAFGGPFESLAQLAPGEVLWVTTGQGRNGYRVIGVRYASDVAPPPLGTGKGRLTLVTATGGDYAPSGVVRVDADLVTAVQPSGPMPLSGGALALSERTLAGEPVALLPIVLWGQLLVLVAAGFAWARYRWGRWQAWLSGMPLALAISLALSDQVLRLLPNLL